MVSEQEIAECVSSVLKSTIAAGGDASLSAVVQQAEANLGVDLSHKADFIRAQMDLFFGPRLQPAAPKPPPPQVQSQSPIQPQTLVQPQPHPIMVQLPGSSPLALQPGQIIFQAVPAQRAGAAGVAVQQQQAVPAMAFYPPPPLAFRYANAAQLGSGGTVSFQQPQSMMWPPGMSAAAISGAAAGAQATDASATVVKRKRGGPGGLNKSCGISPELQTIVGETVMSRTQIVKQLWAYIRKNNLQDPDDKRKIICNEELKVVFGTDSTDMFKMNKLLSKHITPLDQHDTIREGRKHRAPNDAKAKNDTGHSSRDAVLISDALAKFIGSDQGMLPDDAFEHVWDYIKANQLEDVMSASIICDSKLQELFGCETIPMSRLSALLSQHIVKKK